VGQLIYPDTMKYLPLWCLGINKTAALRPGRNEVHADERVAVGHEIMACSVPQLLLLAYPALYHLGDTGVMHALCIP
jgi:protein transport protein SEC24